MLQDLALILILAGVVSIVFKRLRQPLVLGYIVAGFLAGPHMPYMPSVHDTEGIELWSQIGVIFLMFSLGLEFSIKKILRMGARPIITAFLVMFCMMGVGGAVGHHFRWGDMDCLFLGGMLAMSSTTIIYKAYSDLQMLRQKFVSRVLSVLVLEDILGIVLMVMLSAMAVSRQFEGTAMVTSLLQLGAFLILWFVVGVFIIPIFLRYTRHLLNRETLLIFACGLCFVMVIIAQSAGYSEAFGAFIMGSILAETVEAESIGRVVAPIKDLFGAIFFVSVGMLVEPMIIVDYWKPVLYITLAILVGQAIFGSLSFLLTGHSPRTAVQCGFSLAQIGEFAFIIASMGITLGVTSPFLYPIVVAVSIITTFLTPYMIRAAIPVYNLAAKIMHPVRRFTSYKPSFPIGDVQLPMAEQRHYLLTFLRALTMQVAVYYTLSIAIVVVALGSFIFVCRGIFGHWTGNTICGVLALLVAAPFLRAIVMRKNHTDSAKQLVKSGGWGRWIVCLLFIIRFLLALGIVYKVLDFLSPFWWVWHIIVAALIVALICWSKHAKYASIRLEHIFFANLNRRATEMPADEAETFAERLRQTNGDSLLQLHRIVINSSSTLCGKSLAESGIREQWGCQVVGIETEESNIELPQPSHVISAGDVLWIVGAPDAISELPNV